MKLKLTQNVKSNGRISGAAPDSQGSAAGQGVVFTVTASGGAPPFQLKATCTCRDRLTMSPSGFVVS